MQHSFDIYEAKDIGVNAAILLNNIRFWVAKNAANNKHCHDGAYWTYNSVSTFELLFPYMTKDQIRRGLEKLVDTGLIKTGCFNDDPYNRTKWFSCQVDLAIMPNEVGNNAKSLSADINTDVNNGDSKFNPLTVHVPF